jgi:hypothetical protein
MREEFVHAQAAARWHTDALQLQSHPAGLGLAAPARAISQFSGNPAGAPCVERATLQERYAARRHGRATRGVRHVARGGPCGMPWRRSSNRVPPSLRTQVRVVRLESD